MTFRIGIPRALQFFEYYPLWRTFFESLGANVVISPPTNREIVTAGAKVVADVTCLPVKVYAGHVAWLRDHGQVDFVFTPAIWNLEKDAFHCSKFKGLPDIMRATLPDCPPLLDIEIDPQGRKIFPEQAFRRMGQLLTYNPWKIKQAWRNACEVDRSYRSSLVTGQLTYPEALAERYGKELSCVKRTNSDLSPHLTIALVGHPYCLYDDYLNHNLIARLGDLGIQLLTSEMVSVEDACLGIKHTTRETRWFYENWMSGAAGYYLQLPRVDGLIAALAFACGPDSTMVETISRRAHAFQRPFMSLVLDEHGSATGMVTRLEAFVDMLARQVQVRQTEIHPIPTAPLSIDSQKRPAWPMTPPTVLRENHKPVLGVPRMGTTIVPIKSIFRGIGTRLELGPPPSGRTVSLGAQYGPEFICTPYKYILGNMLEMLEAGADMLLYVEGKDLCRNSSYNQMLCDVVHDLGYRCNFATFGALYEGGVFALPQFLRQFVPELSWQDVLRELRLGFAKMFALDEIERQVQYIRPREITPGSADKVWDEALLRIDDVMDMEAFKHVKRDLLHKIKQAPIDPTLQPVKIAITGEIYAVLDPFFNLDIERELGRLGAEVHRTLMISDWFKGEMVLEALGFPHRPDIARAVKPYLRWNVSGEGWASLGETILHAQKGFDGVVEVLPFTCEPEVVALNILPRLSREHNIPVINFIFDEQSGKAGMKTRLEAFVDLLYRRREMKQSNSRAE